MLTCPCGFRTRATYDSSIRRWRHLDLGSCRLLLESEIRRVDCPHCGRVRTEQVPWARLGARHTRDFEDVVAFLAQRVDKTTIARLLRCSWEAVANIVMRVVANHIDDSRLDDLYRIGVDEIAYRKGHRYLTIVADHDKGGAAVWASEGRESETLKAFYDELGDDRKAKLEAVSLDMGSAYAKDKKKKGSAAILAGTFASLWTPVAEAAVAASRNRDRTVIETATRDGTLWVEASVPDLPAVRVSIDIRAPRLYHKGRVLFQRFRFPLRGGRNLSLRRGYRERFAGASTRRRVDGYGTHRWPDRRQKEGKAVKQRAWGRREIDRFAPHRRLSIFRVHEHPAAPHPRGLGESSSFYLWLNNLAVPKVLKACLHASDTL